MEFGNSLTQIESVGQEQDRQKPEKKILEGMEEMVPPSAVSCLLQFPKDFRDAAFVKTHRTKND
jgi:hypothetical protein